MPLIPGRTAEYRKRLADPGKRSTIPNAYLQHLAPALYAKRQGNAAAAKSKGLMDAAYDPMAQLSGSQIGALASRLAGVEYNPQIDQAKTDRRLAIANDAALAERVAGYHQGAATQLANSHEALQTGASSLATELANTRTQTLGAIDQDNTKDQQGIADDAALRGNDVSGGQAQRLAQDFQAQRAGIASNMAAQENVGNVAGQGWAGLVGMMQGAEAMRGADAQSQVAIGSANREAGIQGDIDKLVAGKAGKTAENINTLRGSEYEKAVTAQTLNIKQQGVDAAGKKEAFDEKYKAATLKATQQYRLATNQLRRDLAKQAHGDRSAALNERIKHDQANERNAASRLTVSQNAEARQQEKLNNDIATQDKTGGVKMRTPLQQSQFATHIQHMVQGIIPALKSGKGIANPNFDDSKDESSQNQKYIIPPKKGGYTRKEIGKIIQQDPNSPEALTVTAALDVAIDHHLSPGTVRALQAAGIRVKDLPYRTRKMASADHYPMKGGSGAGA